MRTWPGDRRERPGNGTGSVSTPERELPRPEGVASGKPSPFDFVGRLTAVVTILPVTHEAVRAMLPTGLELAAQDLMTGDRHPLVLMLGRQSDVPPSLLPLGADGRSVDMVFGVVEFALVPPLAKP